MCGLTNLQSCRAARRVVVPIALLVNADVCLTICGTILGVTANTIPGRGLCKNLVKLIIRQGMLLMCDRRLMYVPSRGMQSMLFWG